MKTAIAVLFLVALPVLAQVSAPQVPTSGSLGQGGVFPLLNHGTIVMATDADYTMAYPDMSATIIVVTSSVSLTTTRNVINPSNTLGWDFTVKNSTTGSQSIVIKGTTGTGVTIPNGALMRVVSDGINYIQGTAGAASSLTGAYIDWNASSGGASILNKPTVPTSASWPGAGTCTGGQYVTTLVNGSPPTCAQVSYSQLGGTVPTWNQSTTGNAATATNLSTSGTATQVWGMNSGGTAQGWQPPPTSGPAYSQVFTGIAMSSTAGPITLSCGTTCTAITPSSDTSYRLTGTITQTSPGTGTCTAGDIQFWLSYTDPDSSNVISNLPLATINIGGVTWQTNMAMGAGANSGGNTFNIIPITIRDKGTVAVQFRIQQTVGTGSCTTQPVFTMRLAFY